MQLMCFSLSYSIQNVSIFTDIDIRQAQNESMYAMDFVALLLSSYKPAIAEVSMSRHLKEIAPLASLGMDRIKVKPKEIDSETKLVAKGWKSECLSSAAKSLLDASTRLDQEADREGRYWEELLKVKNAGWALCRFNRDSQSLGVRYGFAECRQIFVVWIHTYTNEEHSWRGSKI